MPERRFLPVIAALLLAACARPAPLTPARAKQIVESQVFRSEPVYAEVPMTVRFGPSSPEDAYDGLSVRTLRNLERAGVVTVQHEIEKDGTEVYRATVTRKGFPLLGTVPSARGTAFRAMICRKLYDGVRNFVRHPTDPTVGRVEIVWHYGDPTPLYPMFETRIDKPLDRPMVSIASIRWESGAWHLDIVVKKEPG
ncbi:MAG: hypothetical protein WBX15_01730 [Thermoanaerobaculia bacterium]